MNHINCWKLFYLGYIINGMNSLNSDSNFDIDILLIISVHPVITVHSFLKETTCACC